MLSWFPVSLMAFALLSGSCKSGSKSEGGETPKEEASGKDGPIASGDSTTPASSDSTSPASEDASKKPTEVPLAKGSRQNPVGFGEQVAFKDKWKVRVLSVTSNANDIVAAENQFNSPPKEGFQFFMVRIEAIYEGEDKDNLLGSTFTLVGKLAVSYKTFSDSCGVIPEDLDRYKDVFKGGRLEGNMCWQVKKEDLGTLLLYDAWLDTPIFMSLIPPDSGTSNTPSSPTEESGNNKPQYSCSEETVGTVIKNICQNDARVGANLSTDDLKNTFWHSDNMKNGDIKWIAYDFGSSTTVGSIGIFNDYSNSYAMGELAVQTSSDSTNGSDGNWTKVKSIAGDTSDFAGGDGTITFDAPVSARWVRLNMTYQGRGAYGTSPAFYISEVKFHP